jgi:hypothetical protein
MGPIKLLKHKKAQKVFFLSSKALKYNGSLKAILKNFTQAFETKKWSKNTYTFFLFTG